MADDDLFDLDELDQMLSDLGGRRNQKPVKSKPKTQSKKLDTDFDDLLDFGEPKVNSKPQQVVAPAPAGGKCYPNAYLTPSGEVGITRHGKIR